MFFKGDTDNISDIQFRFMEEILSKQGFGYCYVVVEPVGAKGDNYIAAVKRFIAKDKMNKEFHMIVKIAPTQEFLRTLMITPVMFMNETLMYSKVLPTFKDLLKHNNNKNECEFLKFKYPECYGFSVEAPYEIIALEDLKRSGYEIRDKLVSLTDKEIKLVLEQLAQFHSLSFVLKAKDPKAFDEFKHKLFDMWTLIHKTEGGRENLMKKEVGTLSLFDTEEEKQISKGAIENILDVAAERRNASLESPYSAILQGDCWTNNLMFKFENDEPVDCMMIDYQVSRVGSPALDIMYLIFNCTDYETRSNHYHDWVDYYHECLSKSLSYFNMNVDTVYPRSQLDSDLKSNGRYAYGLCLILSVVVLRESHEAIDVKESTKEELEELMNTDDAIGLENLKEIGYLRIKKRVCDLCKSFKEYNYI